MKWEDFLAHPTATSHPYTHESLEKYLLEKILHDLLACLSNNLGYASIISTIPDVPQATIEWFDKWKPTFEITAHDIAAFWPVGTSYQPSDSPKIPYLIHEIAQRFDGLASKILFDSNNIPAPPDSSQDEFKMIGIKNIKCFQLIIDDMKNEVYLRLLTQIRYSDLLT